MQEPYKALVPPFLVPSPPKYAAGYPDNKTIQEELGGHVNFTVLGTAASTGYFVRRRNLGILGELLDGGVKVAHGYGDRDYQCNCELLSP
ncbi:hypothetical protein DL769_005507 [Monosporascus sp. CRB-8-3]|nr:hypothetical protein DL769_005507 [Monosporascus sp. CRB-8-3]